jgi:hypothetical protein
VCRGGSSRTSRAATGAFLSAVIIIGPLVIPKPQRRPGLDNDEEATGFLALLLALAMGGENGAGEAD